MGVDLGSVGLCVPDMAIFLYLRASIMYVQTFAFKQLESASSLLQKSLLTVNIKFHSPVVFFFTTILCFFFKIVVLLTESS